MEYYYKPLDTLTIQTQLNEATKLKAEFKRLIDGKKELWLVLQEKLKIDWTYNSNAIEGSTLTLGETTFFLQQGLTVEGKPLQDFLDARNHVEAIDYLKDVIADIRPVNEGVIKEINSLLLTDITYTKAIDEDERTIKKTATPGQYKKLPNHILQADGAIHRYVDPLQVSIEMEILCDWINQNLDTTHPAIVAAIAHYNLVRIHPFDVGNGRGARILMNLILLKKGYPPAVIRNERRRTYIETLTIADNGDLEPFISFVIEALNDTQNMIIKELTK